jgi:hypothetical protein
MDERKREVKALVRVCFHMATMTWIMIYYTQILGKYPEFKVFDKYNYWPINDFIRLYLKTSSAKNKRIEGAAEADCKSMWFQSASVLIHVYVMLF